MDTADALILGLAGPVSDGLHGKLTNGSLEVDFSDLKARYGIPRCRVINDFMAEAYGCLTEIGDQARCIVRPEFEANPPGRCEPRRAGSGHRPRHGLSGV